MRLEIDSIQKSYHGRKILQDVAMSCETGEIVGLLGRNGAGKSTLFRIAFGILKAESSFVRVGGKVLQNQRDRSGRLFYLPQDSFLPQNLKVKKLLRLFCDDENFKTLAENPFVKPFLDSCPKSLSNGELRAIEVLVALSAQVYFVMLDEPFHSLSPLVVQHISEFILLKSKEKGIIISDHQYREVMKISDKNYLLSGTSLKLIKDENNLKFYKFIR